MICKFLGNCWFVGKMSGSVLIRCSSLILQNIRKTFAKSSCGGESTTVDSGPYGSLG